MICKPDFMSKNKGLYPCFFVILLVKPKKTNKMEEFIQEYMLIISLIALVLITLFAVVRMLTSVAAAPEDKAKDDWLRDQIKKEEEVDLVRIPFLTEKEDQMYEQEDMQRHVRHESPSLVMTLIFGFLILVYIFFEATYKFCKSFLLTIACFPIAIFRKTKKKQKVV